ncbi:MAG: glycosyltransferase [Pseudomonadota bacterium]
MNHDEKKADVLVVTRHFAERWGGGEHSLAAVIEEFQAARPDWRWRISDGGFDPPGRLRPLPLFQLLRHRGALRREAASFNHNHNHNHHQGRLALIQSLVGPAMLNALPSSVVSVYFVRDVRYWDEWPNHETGWRWAAKAGYRLAMAPAWAAFRYETRQALTQASLVVANSAFMAGRIRAFCGREALMVYPRTPVAAVPLAEGTVVGMVGDGADKGERILRALARRFPAVTFRLHVRHPASRPLPDNVVLAGWEKDPARLYQGVRLMLVPSQVAEAYGRVAAEALGHGVPVLASRIGGLPETLPNLDWTVADPANLEAWCAAFDEAWQSASARRAEAHAFAVARRIVVDAQHQQLIKRCLMLVEGA